MATSCPWPAAAPGESQALPWTSRLRSALPRLLIESRSVPIKSVRTRPLGSGHARLQPGSAQAQGSRGGRAETEPFRLEGRRPGASAGSLWSFCFFLWSRAATVPGQGRATTKPYPGDQGTEARSRLGVQGAEPGLERPPGASGQLGDLVGHCEEARPEGHAPLPTSSHQTEIPKHRESNVPPGPEPQGC